MPRTAATPILALCLLLAAPQPAPPTVQEPPPLVETQQVTAFDLLVELTRPGKPQRAVEAPAGMAPDEFTLLWDGEPLPVVALAAGATDPEPWRLVVYFDRVLSSSHTIRWGAMELAERAAELAALGEVEIVVAEPEPRRALAPSRDASLIDDSLSGIFLEPAGTSRLVLEREEFLIRRGEGRSAESAARAALRASRRERLLVRRQTDRLLDWLVRSEPPTSRRAVLLVGDGWDLRPEAFYAAAGGPPAAPDSGDEIAGLAATLAAYGWVAAPLAPPPPPVGTGRFGAFVLPDHTFPWLFAVKLRSLEVWLDRNRRPKRADALVELAGSLRDRGELEEAVETYREAIYHYYDHPKTARRQAAALVALGETLELLERPREARAAFRTATVFDPGLATRFPFAEATLRAPTEPLAQLARRTVGTLVRDSNALDQLLLSLGHRVRLTAQLAGLPDGGLHRLDVQCHRAGFEHRAPQAARWGTPPAIVELRLRQLLDGELGAGGLQLTASVVAGETTGDGQLVIQLEVAEAADRGGLLVSWASAGAETDPRFQVRARGVAAGQQTATVAVEAPADQAWLALLVEDPATGAWGGETLELTGDRASPARSG